MSFKVIFFTSILIAFSSLVVRWSEVLLFSELITLDLFSGVIASLFISIGIYVGMRFNNAKKLELPKKQIQAPPASIRLTNREREVLQLMAKGASNQKIADELCLSLSTIKTHSSKLFDKLGVKNRTEAVYQSRKLKILLEDVDFHT